MEETNLRTERCISGRVRAGEKKREVVGHDKSKEKPDSLNKGEVKGNVLADACFNGSLCLYTAAGSPISTSLNVSVVIYHRFSLKQWQRKELRPQSYVGRYTR
jgi:hypothetical protein